MPEGINIGTPDKNNKNINGNNPDSKPNDLEITGEHAVISPDDSIPLSGVKGNKKELSPDLEELHKKSQEIYNKASREMMYTEGGDPLIINERQTKSVNEKPVKPMPSKPVLENASDEDINKAVGNIGK